MADSKYERVYKMPFSDIYGLYVQKVERKDRTEEELGEVLRWLTGHNEAGLREAAASDKTLRTFFEEAPASSLQSDMVTGVVCGVRVEEVDEPLMRQIRAMDKVVDELAKGKAVEKIIRS